FWAISECRGQLPEQGCAFLRPSLCAGLLDAKAHKDRADRAWCYLHMPKQARRHRGKAPPPPSVKVATLADSALQSHHSSPSPAGYRISIVAGKSPALLSNSILRSWRGEERMLYDKFMGQCGARRLAPDEPRIRGVGDRWIRGRGLSRYGGGS